MPATIEETEGSQKTGGCWQVYILLALAVILWFLLRGPGSDPDGLNYALNMEAGDPVRFLGTDHLLWHLLVWCGWILAKLVAPAIRPVPVQQLVNLLLVGASLYLFCRYLILKGKPWHWAALGLLASFAGLRAMAGEHVDSGSLLAATILCFLLPNSPRRPKLWLQPILLATFPWLHKSLIIFFLGYFLAYLCFSSESFPKRITKPLLITIVATLITLIGFGLVWIILPNGSIPFGSWLASYVGKETGFWAGDLKAVGLGIPVSLYRMFLSLSPYKAWQMGSVPGLAGLGISAIFILGLLTLAYKTAWRGKNDPTDQNSSKESLGILLAVAPSVIFFCFWMPGMYYFWSRFLPAVWLILALRSPYRGFSKVLTWSLPAMLLVVNVPSLFQAKNGEEAGRLTQWIGGTVAKGDMIFVSGDGVLFDGRILDYHLGMKVVMLDYLSHLDANEGWLRSQVSEVQSSGKHIWLVTDRGRWSTNRVISGESDSIQKGMAILEVVCSIGEEKRFNDPGFENAGISECNPR